ncbi:RNA polymerase recycling motor ATPase HelR [Luteipulveratus halotolerans]|uniref:ATPase AAA n=1 Tax=Luteipulveratus halotolerans TaxID=1631356 RepID=A0A0L6CLL6_9MICO|nr:RNA polymerase recycling motor ATPase HelR [Luteipulveratus halotolerans]KNX38525.1 ATPase AAA [Luteipulveratus halotolerans]
MGAADARIADDNTDVRRPAASAFDLPDRLAAKAATELIEQDERQFGAIAESLADSIADLEQRLEETRRRAAGGGQQALDRDQEVHRLTARLKTLRRFGLDLCLGRMVAANGETTYVGRLGLTDADADGTRLLVDWRSPAAEPFFGATHGDPMGLLSRRRYRWNRGRINDYWDEVFTAEGMASSAALDDQSAFIASLGTHRSARMRDVLGTIQADQDAIIRAGSQGALVVDGGPGTGKTVVALHRSAYLLYADPRLSGHRGGVLFVGPHEPYLAYVADVLPSLGEDGVRTCTVRDLVPEGAAAVEESNPEVARLKASAELVGAVEKAVAFYEEPPTTSTRVDTPWGDAVLTAREWAVAFRSAHGVPHNEARDEVWDDVVSMLVDTFDLDQDIEDEYGDSGGGEVTEEQLREWFDGHRGLRATFHEAWPVIEAADLVGDLWTVPAYLKMCAPSLSSNEIRALQRDDPSAWTVADLPFLDAARHRLGDPEASRRRRQRDAAIAAQRKEREAVVEHLIEDDDSEMHLMSMLRAADLQGALDDESAVPARQPDALAGPFAHVVVDEAQELTDAEWQMLLQRSPSHSITVVGDRAQARHGFTESWQERLARVGLDRVTMTSLSINYRTPQEVMTEAEPVIRAALPDANVPTSVRSSGLPVRRASASELRAVLDAWFTEHAEGEGVACVIAESGATAEVSDAAYADRVRVLTPELAKGLEFDLVVLVAPDRWGEGIEGAVDRYVAMTRATQELVILS